MATRKRKAASRRQALFVLGMHRSGTSAVSGVMALLGAQAPRTLMAPTKDNPRGYFESTEIMRANDRILSSAGSRWNDWGPFNPAWFESGVADRFREELPALLEKEFGDAPLLLIKDPRICRFFPFWKQSLDGLGIDSRVVVPVRNPLEIARSLEARDKFGRNRSLLLWLRHMLDAEASSRDTPRVFVRFESLLDDWKADARRIEEALGLTWTKWSGDTEMKVDEFLSHEHKHFEADDAVALGEGELAQWTEQAHRDFLALAAGKPADRAMQVRLDGIRAEFDRTARTYAAVVREHETRVEGLYAGVKAQLAESRQQLEATSATAADAARKLEAERKALAEEKAQAAKLREQAEARARQLKDIDERHAQDATLLKSRLAAAEAERAQLAAQLAATYREAELRSEGLQASVALQVAEKTKLAEALAMRAEEGERQLAAREQALAEERARVASLAEQLEARRLKAARTHERHGQEMAEVAARLAVRDAEVVRLASEAAAQAREHEARLDALRSAMKQQVDERTSQLELERARHDEVQRRLQAEAAALAEQQALVRALNQELEAQAAEVGRHADAGARLQGEVDALRARLVARDGDVERLSAEQQQAAREYEVRVDGLRASMQLQLGEQQQLHAQLQARHDATMRDLEAARAEVAARQQDIAGLAAQLADRDEAIEALTAQLADRDEAIEVLTAQLADRDEAIEALTAQLADRDEAVEALTAQLAGRDEAIEALAARLADRDQHVETLAAQLANRQQDIDALAAQLDDAGAGLAEREAQLADRDRRLDDRAAELAGLESDLAASVRELGDRTAELDAVRAQLREGEQALAAAVARTEALGKELADLGDRHRRESLETAARLSAQRESTAAAASRHAAELADLRQSLAKAQAEVDARFKEIAKLTTLVFEFEQAKQADASHRVLLEYERAVRMATAGELAHVAHLQRQQLDQVRASKAWRWTRPFHAELPEIPAVVDWSRQLELLRGSELFDREWYLASYPDVVETGLDPVDHYLRQGAMEGRNPGPQFDTLAYLSRYPDVRQSALNPLAHYEEYGRSENRVVVAAAESGKA